MRNKIKYSCKCDSFSLFIFYWQKKLCICMRHSGMVSQRETFGSDQIGPFHKSITPHSYYFLTKTSQVYSFKFRATKYWLSLKRVPCTWNLELLNLMVLLSTHPQFFNLKLQSTDLSTLEASPWPIIFPELGQLVNRLFFISLCSLHMSLRTYRCHTCQRLIFQLWFSTKYL